MKSIIARATLVAVCICLLVGFTATRLHAGEYFIYQDAKGRLIISNQKPLPGSKIIKQQTLPDTAEGETTLVQDGNETRPNGDATPSKPSNKE
jgi:K+-transporting ATPase c subunit